MFVWLATGSNQDLAIFGEDAGVKGAEGVAQTCTALTACPTVALQSVLSVVPGTVHCHVRNNTTPQKLSVRLKQPGGGKWKYCYPSIAQK